MSKCLATRSENDIKNKWYSMQRKQQRLLKKIEDEYDEPITGPRLKKESFAQKVPHTKNVPSEEELDDAMEDVESTHV